MSKYPRTLESWEPTYGGRHQSRKALLQVAIRAADAVLSKAKRPSEALKKRATTAAFQAILRADPAAGTTHHKHGVEYSHRVHALAVRGMRLASRRHFASSASLTADYRRDRSRTRRRGRR